MNGRSHQTKRKAKSRGRGAEKKNDGRETPHGIKRSAKGGKATREKGCRGGEGAHLEANRNNRKDGARTSKGQQEMKGGRGIKENVLEMRPTNVDGH